jgi:hypothetical protein
MINEFEGIKSLAATKRRTHLLLFYIVLQPVIEEV